MTLPATARSPALRPEAETATGRVPVARPVGVWRHVAWLVGGMAGAFLVPFILADRLGLQRDLYYGIYAAAVAGLFVAWARDTRQPLREMLARRWRLAVGLGVVFAAISAFVATRAEDGRFASCTGFGGGAVICCSKKPCASLPIALSSPGRAPRPNRLAAMLALMVTHLLTSKQRPR